jgi:outer membrane protein assembly factor BamB
LNNHLRSSARNLFFLEAGDEESRVRQSSGIRIKQNLRYLEAVMRSPRKYLSAALLIGAVSLLCVGGYLIAKELARGVSKNAARTAMFLNGPSHSGVSQSAEIKNFGGLQWRFQTGGAVRSSPVLADGFVYVGSSDGYMYALDASTGAERWKLNAQSAITSTPAVVNGTVYVGTWDGRFLALKAASGEVLWSVKTGADAALAWGYESGDFFTSSPTVLDGKVLCGGGDGFLYALESTTGRELWKVKTGGRVRSTPAVDRGTVFVGSFDGSLYAVELESGQLKWHYETEGAGLNSGDFGYDRKSIQSSPAVADGTVFFGARDGFLYAVNAQDGQLRWRFDHQISWVNSSPAVAEGMVYAGSSDGKFIQGVDARTGKEVWRLKTESLIWSSPAIAGQSLYVGDWAGNLYALNRSNGGELWRYRAHRRILSSPLLAEGRLYFGSDDGAVYAINPGRATALKRAVFWDADYVKTVTFRGHEALRDYLKANDYEVVNAQTLAGFLNERISDKAPSVVVFAIDYLPQTISPDGNGQSLLRTYLDSGGKAVWVGMPPLLWAADLQTGQRDIKKIDRSATEKLLGVGHKRGNFDANTARPTAEGIKWGLGGWWLSSWSADPESVTTILAEDEQGLAAAWVRRYGGPEGTGFIRLPIVETPGGNPTNLPEIRFVAERLPQ